MTSWLQPGLCVLWKKAFGEVFNIKVLAARASNLQILLLLFGEFKLISIPPEIRKKP